MGQSVVACNTLDGVVFFDPQIKLLYHERLYRFFLYVYGDVMIDVSTAQFLVNTISFFFAYCFVVTIGGAFRAWVASYLGDYTAEDEGYLTLSPMAHVSPIGLIFLVLRSFGVGHYIPVDPNRVHGKFRPLRLFLLYYSDTLLHTICACIGLMILIATFSPLMIHIVESMVINRNISHLYMTYYYPEYSSIAITMGFMLAALVTLHIGLVVIEFLFNSLMILFYVYLRSQQLSMQDTATYELLAWLLIVLFFFTPLIGLVTSLISWVGYTACMLLHIIQ